MKKIISYIFFIIATVSQAQVNVQWVQNSAGVSIAVDSNNNVYTVYYEYNPAGDIYLAKRNSDGVFIWQEKFDQTDNSKWEKATWVATDNLGNHSGFGNIDVGLLESGRGFKYTNEI